MRLQYDASYHRRNSKCSENIQREERNQVLFNRFRSILMKPIILQNTFGWNHTHQIPIADFNKFNIMHYEEPCIWRSLKQSICAN